MEVDECGGKLPGLSLSLDWRQLISVTFGKAEGIK